MSRSVDVCGLRIDALTMDQTVEAVAALLREGLPAQQVSVNAAKVVEADHDPTMADLINAAALTNADGQSVLWAGRLLGTPLPERVPGIDLMLRLWDEAARRDWSVYLFGARPEVLERTAAIARERGVRVVGSRSGFYDDEDAVVAGIASAAPDLLFVALPTPEKERFVARNLHRLRAGFAMGVGGSFDVVAGEVDRAPAWMQRAGIEWAHRLLREPSRLLRPYVLQNLLFFVVLAKHAVRSRFRSRGRAIPRR